MHHHYKIPRIFSGGLSLAELVKHVQIGLKGRSGKARELISNHPYSRIEVKPNNISRDTNN
jgi:hypothetical protein